MNTIDKKNKLDKCQTEEYKRNSMINFADSINRSTIGEPKELTRGGCLTRIISTFIIIGILTFFLLYYR